MTLRRGPHEEVPAEDRHSITWPEYVTKFYASDLASFVAAHKGGIQRRWQWFGDVNQLSLCDASMDVFKRELDAAPLSSRLHFTINLTLEAVLLAGVHQYDLTNFQSYVERLPFVVHVEAYPSLGVRRPHVLLVGQPVWDAEALALLTEGCVTLLPSWARKYDENLLVGAAVTVLNGLAADPDLKANPYNSLPAGVVEALGSGLAQAAEVVG